MKTLRLVPPALLVAAAAPAFTRPSGGDRPPRPTQRPPSDRLRTLAAATIRPPRTY